MYAVERQQAMARLVDEHGRLSVASIAERFGVTTETVRRDLSALDRLGLVRRVHGGAVPAGPLAATDRDPQRSAATERVAQAATRELPGSGGVVLLDAGPITARLAGLLPRDRRLTVVTRAVPVAARLAGLPQVDLHVLPGRVGQPTRTAVGAETVAAIERLRADVAFLDVEGLSVGHGLSTDDHDEAAVRGAAVAVARRVVCLGYSSSIGVERPVRFARVDDVDVLVTDDGLPAPDRAALEAAGPEVVVA